MFQVTELPSGNLLITADNDGRQDLKTKYTQGGYPAAESEVFQGIEPGWRQVAPEHIGALTDAPIICSESDQPNCDDHGENWDCDPAAVFYWFPNYMICDPWESLKNTGRVEFERAA